MELKPLRFDAPLKQYLGQAEQLLAAHAAGEEAAIRLFHQKHPRFLDSEIKWLPLRIPDSEIRDARLDLSDAQLAIAGWYDFRDWNALSGLVDAVAHDSGVRHFETAVEAVVDGNVPALEQLLRNHPELVRSRSTRVVNFDPPAHRATLLHYLGANGVEGFRQRTPKQAVAIATLLLQAGAEPDALADMYGGKCTTMSMLVSSTPPAKAGLQVALIETLVDFGASVDPCGEGNWQSPVFTALIFGFIDAAEALVRRGARVNDFAVAAGLGRVAEAAKLLQDASAESRHMGLALAAQLGRLDVVRLLLDAGEDPNRYNPEGGHAHSTPLHQAAIGGHEAVVRMLAERGAALDQKDKIHHSTPVGWAVYGGKTAIADYLRSLRPGP